MSAPYSNKALPPGTILREWRLEHVLGVGGFGIVYKGREIYFDEPVAIKEYFPTSISDRQEDGSVVPVDSEVGEIHSKGLLKFVEEAKLLWNLSTPARIPSIVNVRSLFETNGTAYMVMDFEDGIPLSRLLRQGRHFEQAELVEMIRPIAEGLSRAHTEGVLHRDIKPANILVGEDGRSVLIDFGSAHMEARDITTSRIGFHTPPYAAIEQYVKTYEQGPWTDIYALGVVLYECIAGERPPDVLERMHGGLGMPLANGEWPGYTHDFLTAVDAAMAIKPIERPQSIAQWLAMFGPATPFTPADALADSEDQLPSYPPAPSVQKAAKRVVTPLSTPQDAGTGDGKPMNRAPLFITVGLAAIAIAVAGGWYLSRWSDTAAPDDALVEVGTDATAIPVVPVNVDDAGGVAAAVKALADEALEGGAPSLATTRLSSASEQLAAMDSEYRALLADPAKTEAARIHADEMTQMARTAAGQFSSGILRDAEVQAMRLARTAPWADPRNPEAASGATAEQRKIAAEMRIALTRLRVASGNAVKATDPGEALGYARQTMVLHRSFAATMRRTSRLSTTAGGAAARTPRPAVDASAAAAIPYAEQPAPVVQVPVIGSTEPVTSAQRKQLKSALDNARDVSRQVIRLGNRDRPDNNATELQKQAYRVRQANMQTARDYERYLDTLEASMRGNRTRSEAEQLIAQANQTRGYLNQIFAESRASLD